MTQVFARYAKDILEKQTYPEVRRSPTSPPEPPYDVSAWSLGMLLGVDHVMARKPLADTLKLTRLDAAPTPEGKVTGTPSTRLGAGGAYVFDYRGPDAAKAINRLLKDGARVSLKGEHAWVVNAPRKSLDSVAADLGMELKAADAPVPAGALAVKAPRIGMYSPWTGGNMDEGWTRWVLEQYEFNLTTLHNAEMRTGRLREKFDVIVL